MSVGSQDLMLRSPDTYELVIERKAREYINIAGLNCPFNKAKTSNVSAQVGTKDIYELNWSETDMTKVSNLIYISSHRWKVCARIAHQAKLIPKAKHNKCTIKWETLKIRSLELTFTQISRRYHDDENGFEGLRVWGVYSRGPGAACPRYEGLFTWGVWGAKPPTCFN